jgi:hypothetical protein
LVQEYTPTGKRNLPRAREKWRQQYPWRQTLACIVCLIMTHTAAWVKNVLFGSCYQRFGDKHLHHLQDRRQQCKPDEDQMNERATSDRMTKFEYIYLRHIFYLILIFRIYYICARFTKLHIPELLVRRMRNYGRRL